MAYITIGIDDRKQYNEVMNALKGIVNDNQILSDDPMFHVRDRVWDMAEEQRKHTEILERIASVLEQRM